MPEALFDTLTKAVCANREVRERGLAAVEAEAITETNAFFERLPEGTAPASAALEALKYLSHGLHWLASSTEDAGPTPREVHTLIYATRFATIAGMAHDILTDAGKETGNA